MPETMAAVVWQGGETVVADVPRPEVRPGWSVLEVGYNGLCGTDLHITAGEHPRARPPLVIGHEVVGRGPIFVLVLQCTTLERVSRI
jgi:(R,R)-butanediol dehydrogenase/meso-butanediol dehydrogenase/diacetyl reductase